MPEPTTSPAADPSSAPPSKPKGNAWKWWLTGVLFLATVLTYLDRQTMSLCGAKICEEFDLNNKQYGQLVSAFRWAYALTHVPAGLMADRLPIRITYALAVGLWSAAGAAAAWVFGFRRLLMTRAVLGVGEAFNWPCATRIVANTFPPNDRGLASGIFNSGAAVGSLIAPLVILPLADYYGWRAAFFTMGTIGFAWIALWLVATRRSTAGYLAVNTGREFSRTYRIAFSVSLLTAGVLVPVLVIHFGDWLLAPLERGLALLSETPDLAEWMGYLPWVLLTGLAIASIVVKRGKAAAFWSLVIVAITVNPCWYFLNEWIPKYLYDQQGFNFTSAGLFTVPIFLSADLGNIVSGGVIKYLTHRGWSLRAARGATLSLAAAMVAPVVTVPYLSNAYLVVGLLALGALGITSIIANYTACQQDYSFGNVGLVAGTLGMSSNVFAALANPRIGDYVDATGTYNMIFLLVGTVPLASLAALLIFDGIIHRGTATNPGKPM